MRDCNDPSGARYGCFLPDLTGLARRLPAQPLNVHLSPTNGIRKITRVCAGFASARFAGYSRFMQPPFDIFLTAPPGLEPWLLDEVTRNGFGMAEAVPGGVAIKGDWPDVWRANLNLRCAVRVLVRIASFRAMHIAQLDKRARKVDWASLLKPDVPVRVEAVCRASKIYHDRAARDRIARAITDTTGAPVAAEAPLRVMLRIEDDLASLSLDTSGELLHRRGYKTYVGKAPLRETMAAAFLRACGYDGTEPVVDPMCGSGSFVIEAAEMSAGLAPGRARRFAFEDLVGGGGPAWEAMKSGQARPEPGGPPRVFGSDRDDGAIRGSLENAERAGVSALCQFTRAPVSALTPPESPPGLVIVNPPYGARIGNRKPLFALYGSLGQVLRDRFAGWRLGMVTSDGGLAKATGLSLDASPPVAFGGLTVKLYQARL